MGQTLTKASLKIILDHAVLNALDLNSIPDALNKSYSSAYTNGTGASKAQEVWHDKRTLLTTANEELDLTALAGGAFGTYNFSKIKALVIHVNTVTSGYRLEIGGAASNAFSAFVKDPSDIDLCAASGTKILIDSPIDGATVDSTHKMLKINNPSGGTVEYEIWILGEGTVS